MEDNKAFLRYFLDEEVYIVDKPEVAEKPAHKELVEEPVSDYQSPKTKSKVEEVTLSYTGNNTKSVLVLVESISDDEKVFLSKVLGAVQLKLEDCALVCLENNSTADYQPLIEKFSANIIIQFGGTTVDFIKDVSPYKVNFVGDKKALVANDLKSIMAGVDKKKLLWGCLQQLFV